MDLTFDRPSSRGLLSATQPIPKARSLIPLSGRKSFTPVLGGCATPQTPLKNWSATAVLARIPGSKMKKRSRTARLQKPKAQLFYTAPGDIAEWTPVSGGAGVIDC